MITFRLPAASAQDAEERYLMDAEETSSETVSPRVDSTARLDPDVAGRPQEAPIRLTA
ncbi:hypothetical protein [Streptomyces collinus]|uniref:hypothetical protein n=1 Tax=Streptomyces collinus TaxID=42684 RepID=UPI0036AAD502